MSEEKRAFDRHVAPKQSAELDVGLDESGHDAGCSCHINPPCDYCVSREEADE
jgi:hypothetical protein